MHDEVRQILGGIVGGVIGIVLKLAVFSEHTSFWWWIVFPVLCGYLGSTIAKK